MSVSRRRPWVAAALNLLLVGCGHLYVGQAVRFFVPLALVAIVYVSLGWLGLLSAFVGYLIALILIVGLIIFAVVDAFLLARGANPYSAKWYNHWYIYTTWAIVLVGISLAWPGARSSTFGYNTFRIPSPVMAPAIQSGDYILVDTRAYQKGRSPLPNDVVVVRVPASGAVYVRRVTRVTTSAVEFKTDNPTNQSATPGNPELPISSVIGHVTYVFYSNEWNRIGHRVQ